MTPSGRDRFTKNRERLLDDVAELLPSWLKQRVSNI